LLHLSANTDITDLLNEFSRLGLYQAPAIILPTALPSKSPAQIDNRSLYILGQADLTVSPLQMALAAATLSNNGLLPIPRLVTGIKSPQGGWTIPTGNQSHNVQVFSADQVVKTTNLLAVSGEPFWAITGTAQGGSGKRFTWFTGGTLPGWQGVPLTIVVLLEEDNPVLAENIGMSVLNDALTP
jgi:membrane peptidoglycan carboxypeptidase